MPISAWLLPVLWREHDWRASLARLATELAKTDGGPPAQRAASELGRAFEYVEPDRRRALAAYELAGDAVPRAREIAVELGWWEARARLALAARATDPDPRLVLDEAEAWWDAGQPALCELVLAGARGAARDARAEELAALLAGRDRTADLRARAAATVGRTAADGFVMAARFARAAGRTAELAPCYEAALAAVPGHAIAARGLLALALAGREPERVQRCLQLRVAGLPALARVDGMRACALALIGSPQHRGFGLRVLRQALELAYETTSPPPPPGAIPGHLAMWAALVAQATADGTRLELLPLALRALQACQAPADRVWLGALAAELSLRDAKNPVVAGAYAEIVAEHAPEHPILRELVHSVAAADAPVPPAAIEAATAAAQEAEREGSIDVQLDLDEVYAGAAEAAATATPVEELTALHTQELAALRLGSTQEIEVIQVLEEHTAPHAAPAPRTAPSKPAPSKPAPSKPAPSPAPAVPRVVIPAKPAPAPAAKVAPAKPAARAPGALPSLSRAVPVLAALRTPDRPVLPPKPPTRADALPRARRIAMPIDVTLVLADGTRVAGHSRDISTSGLFVLAEGKLPTGGEVGVELLLPGKEPFMEDEYKARARVARRDESGYGIELVGADAALLAALAAL